MNEEQKKRLRNKGFWNTPNTKLKGDPNVQHDKWNPYENKEIELDYE